MLRAQLQPYSVVRTASPKLSSHEIRFRTLQMSWASLIEVSSYFKIYIKLRILSESGDRNPAFNNASLPMVCTSTTNRDDADMVHLMSSRRLLFHAR